MITTLLALALTLAPAMDGTPAPKPAKPEATASTLLADGTYVYDWILDGKVVGQTTFSLITSAPTRSKTGAEKPAVTRVSSSWNYSARGRQLRSTNSTELTAGSLEARSFTGEQQTMISQRWSAGDKVDASIHNGIMTVRYEQAGKILKHDVVAPEKPYFFANQAFEHMVIVAAVARSVETKEQLFELLDPRGSAATLSTTLTREKTEGDRTRWKLDGLAMQGHYWVDPRGILVRYQQGELEIALQRFTPRSAPITTPKVSGAEVPR